MWAFHKEKIQGPIFRRFFSAENSAEFLRKMIFQTFSAENSFFSQHFWGKFSAEFSGEFPAEFSPEKMYEKSAPGLTQTTFFSTNP
jgi:S-adenosylmethionine:diacylglycerol 3-amino-3-carboxypropyl transferase